MQNEIPDDDAARRVRVLADGIIYVKEVERPTLESVSCGAREVARLSQDLKTFSIIVEFEKLTIPGTDVLHRVSEEVLPLKKKLSHVAVVTQTNVFMKVAIMMISRLSGFSQISVHKTQDLALGHLLSLKAKVD